MADGDPHGQSVHVGNRRIADDIQCDHAHIRGRPTGPWPLPTPSHPSPTSRRLGQRAPRPRTSSAGRHTCKNWANVGGNGQDLSDGGQVATHTDGAGPAGDTAATSARERDTGERRNRGGGKTGNGTTTGRPKDTGRRTAVPRAVRTGKLGIIWRSPGNGETGRNRSSDQRERRSETDGKS